MTKQTLKRKKAIKKLDKAVRKAVDKGLSQTLVGNTVEKALGRGNKKVPAEKAEPLEADDPPMESVASKTAKKQLTKLPGKPKPLTTKLKRRKTP
jgi:hypothetical protein